MYKLEKKLKALKLTEDRKAKSKTFFFEKNLKIRKFEKKHINFLKLFNKKFKEDLRICMHQSLKSLDQNMILLQNRDNFYPPHKHLKCGDTYHVIEGRLLVCFFSNSGKLTSRHVVKSNEVFKSPPNIYHCTKPLTSYVIFHESRAGKFSRLSSSIFPEWLPTSKKEKIKHNNYILYEKN